MQRSELFEQIKAIIVDQIACDPDAVTEDTNFIEDLGADSLDLLQLVTEFEDRFGIEIADEDFEGVKTVRDALDQIAEIV